MTRVTLTDPTWRSILAVIEPRHGRPRKGPLVVLAAAIRKAFREPAAKPRRRVTKTKGAVGFFKGRAA